MESIYSPNFKSAIYYYQKLFVELDVKTASQVIGLMQMNASPVSHEALMYIHIPLSRMEVST